MLLLGAGIDILAGPDVFFLEGVDVGLFVDVALLIGVVVALLVCAAVGLVDCCVLRIVVGGYSEQLQMGAVDTDKIRKINTLIYNGKMCCFESTQHVS